MINNIIVNLEKDIVRLINESNLPISVISLILSKLSAEVKEGLTSTLAQELGQQKLEEAAKEQTENTEEPKQE